MTSQKFPNAVKKANMFENVCPEIFLFCRNERLSLRRVQAGAARSNSKAHVPAGPGKPWLCQPHLARSDCLTSAPSPEVFSTALKSRRSEQLRLFST
ncbi:hypothetical protein PoB_005213500 [Plakobranchus ocellatus]|uniref:Uncharacterized protein n=1 Tax=Plakobranchus ocellatus TaxID=259542 RepID=A0AAV4BYY2_9GAST|nr:hypothetical protein PoB_005213500 [Plakobranchus ocellatus]